ncbi:MAG: hypothetical protein AAGB22_15995, partial [Bacteroidota bacterium]
TTGRVKYIKCLIQGITGSMTIALCLEAAGGYFVGIRTMPIRCLWSGLILSFSAKTILIDQ